MYDPYEIKRQLARQERQRDLERVVTPGLPIDGDPKEVRRPVQRIGDMVDDVLASFQKEIYKSENQFFDYVRENWNTLFPDSPARPGCWSNGRLILYVATAAQSFALRPRLAAITRTLKALPCAPKENFTVIIQIHT